MSIIFLLIIAAGLLWLFPLIFTLRVIGRRHFDTTTLALWILIVLLFPILGVIAFWLVNPMPQTS